MGITVDVVCCKLFIYCEFIADTAVRLDQSSRVLTAVKLKISGSFIGTFDKQVVYRGRCRKCAFNAFSVSGIAKDCIIFQIAEILCRYCRITVGAEVS